MTKEQAIHFILHNPMCKITHTLFAPNEYLYSKGDGTIYDENGYVFEDFVSSCDGMRIRNESVWQSDWTIVLGPGIESSNVDASDELRQLMREWGIEFHMGQEDIDDLVKYLAANGVTVDGKE